MLLFPMHNARQRRLAQLLEVEAHAHRLKTEFFGSVADAQHTHTAAGGGTHLAQSLDGVGLAVMFGNHREAGGAAIHGVGLGEVGEGVHFSD